MVAAVDEGIGNITTYMSERDLLSNTIIIFSSDNGGFAQVGGFNYPYRGMKGGLFEGGMRTPAFIYAPFYFTETSKSVYNGLIHLVDWGPLLLSIVDQTNGNGDLTHDMGDIDGKDLSQILRSKDFEVSKDMAVRTDVILDANGWTNSTSFIYDGYKLILGYNGGDLLWPEPYDEWTRNEAKQWEAFIPDYYNRFIQLFFGPDYWFYEWSFVAVSSRLRDRLRYPDVCSCPIMRHPDGVATSFVDPRPLYMPVSINWNDVTARCMIRLYDLEKDRTESHNIAFENRERVENMVRILNERLKVEEGRMDLMSGLQYGMLHTFIQAFLLVNGIFLLILVVGSLICCKCCGCCCFRPKKKTKTD